MLVATWNLENLYRAGSEFGPPDERSYRAKRDALAATLTEVAPDVLAVQEVGDPAALDDLLDAAGGDWSVALSEFPDDRGIRVGLASRRALRDVAQVHAFPAPLEGVQVDDAGTRLATMGRGALSAVVDGADGPVALLNCHLKSKLLSFGPGRFTPRDEGERARYGAYALFRRAAEAATVRARADELLPGTPLVVLGDLNDVPEAASTQILLGPPGSEVGTTAFDRPDRGDARRLWNLAPLIPEERRFTRLFRGRGELIDHILVSAALVHGVRRVDTVGGPSSIGEDPGERRGEPASDHALLLADLDA